MRIEELIKNMSIEDALIELTRSAIHQLIERRYYSKRDDFADSVSMSPNELTKRLTKNTVFKKHEFDVIWDKIREVDADIYNWAKNKFPFGGNNDNP